MGRIARYLITLLSLSASAADHHQFDGSVKITRYGQSYMAAFRMDDFDPNHTPALGLKNLYRMTLVPMDSRPTVSAASTACLVTASTTKAGHMIWSACGWHLDITPVDKHLRSQNASLVGLSSSAWQQLVFEVVGDEIRITGKE